MKLKIYHIVLLTLLFAVLGVNLMLFGFAIYDMIFNTISAINNVLFIVCFLVLIVLTGLHIGNTIVSFKAGSAFLNNIIFDENKNFSIPSMVFATFGLAIGIILISYGCVILKNHDLFMGGQPAPLKLVLIGAGSLLTLDMVAIFTYPFVAKLDKAYKIKSRI